MQLYFSLQFFPNKLFSLLIQLDLGYPAISYPDISIIRP